MEPDPLAFGPLRVEAYLDQILAPLARRLSPFHREELRRELREHLWARVGAYRELGQSEDEAVTEALRQFGGAEDFTRQWRREWMKTPPKVTLGGVWEAMRPTLYLSSLALLLACLPLILWVYGYAFFQSIPWLGSRLVRYSPLLGETLWVIDLVLLPIGLGLAIAKRAPQKAGLGSLLALSAQVAIGSSLYWISKWMWPTQGWVDIASQPMLLEAGWIPITCTSAALAGWWARRRQTA